MKVLFYVLTFVFLASTNLNAGEIYELALVKELSADPSRLTVADVIDVDKTSPELLKRFGPIALKSNEDGSIQVSHVLMSLSESGANISDVQLVSAPDTQIKPHYNYKVVDQIRNQLTKQLSEQANVKDEIKIKFLSIPKNIPDLNQFATLKVSLDQINQTDADYQFNVEFLDDKNRLISKATLEGDVEIYRNVVVAKKTLLPGDRVTKEDFYETTRLIKKPEQVVLSLSELKTNAWTIRERLSQGSVLTQNLVNHGEQMEVGSVVTLYAGQGSLKVRTLGRVKEVLNGGVSVLVENIDSQKELVGRPLNSREVEIVY